MAVSKIDTERSDGPRRNCSILPKTRIAILIAGCLFFANGCERALERPDFDPAQSGADAITAYDTDGDGKLSEEEIETCPGLVEAAPRVDADNDGFITAEEIADRVEYYRTASVAVISGSIRVTSKGKPLQFATVTFEPESFLGEEFQPCVGETDNFGDAFISREGAEFPGIYLGFYRVKVSKLDKKGKETIPEKYNVHSELGYEAADDLPMVSDVPKFHLN